MPSDSGPRGKRRALLGKYDVLDRVGGGGMGTVYKARDTILDRVVALKVLQPEMAAKPNLVKRFQREARHAARLKHPNIVEIYDFGEASGTYFLAMEFVEGVDLGEYIHRKGMLDPEEARLVMVQAARALDHAWQSQIVHRDIKPSNFLLNRQGETLVVKLTDLGLARDAQDDEHSRVTKDGHTVGTIDYMSPEQARDSSSADVRSDLYSLGCSWFHMLAGNPPFHGGSIVERIYKHVEAEPPDVRQFNPKVSEQAVTVLSRLLAKRPEDRYQTPAELLHDLLHLDAVTTPSRQRDALAALAEDPGLRVKPRRRRSNEAKRPSDSTSRRRSSGEVSRRTRVQREDTVEAARRERRRPRADRGSGWVIGAGVAAVVAALAFVVLAAWLTGRLGGGSGPSAERDVQAPAPSAPKATRREAPPERAPETFPPNAATRWPRLTEPAPVVDVDRLRREFEGPWAGAAGPPADAPRLRVSRWPRGEPGHFDSLAAAFAAAPPGRVSVVEVHDNGPLFEAPAAVSGRSVVVRPGPGYRPLIVWEAAGGESFLSSTNGGLTLEDLDVAVRWENDKGSGPAALMRAAGGDVLARGCTFSVAGRHPAGVAVVRLDGPAGKARLVRCFGRGNSLVALDLHAPGAETFLDGCLLVGDAQPLVRASAAATVRVARSTLVTGATLAQVRPGGALRWHGWDSLLSRCAASSGGELLALPPGAAADSARWDAVNCLYAGWNSLLSGDTVVSASDTAAWRSRWPGNTDRATPRAWPEVVRGDLAEVASGGYDTHGTPVAFAASAGDGRLGCDATALPAARDNWVPLTNGGFVVTLPDGVADAGAPDVEVPSPGDALYHGERLDLDRFDLGDRLRRVQQTTKLGPRVVLRLTGSGERPTSPVRVRGATLVLYFEPPQGDAKPLTLVPRGAATGGQEALIDVEGGDLEVVGGDVRYPDAARPALVLPYLLRARGGDVRVHNTRLQGFLGEPPPDYRGLIALEGSGESAADKARGVAVHESALLSGRGGVHLIGTGARLWLRRSLVVAGTEAVFLDTRASGPAPRLNLQCLLENSTVAAQQSVARLADAPGAAPAEPAVVQARANLFLNPFPGAPNRAGLLLFEGDSLTRGLLVWQGEGNVFDARLYFQAADKAPDQRQPRAAWARTFGASSDRRPLTDVVWLSAFDPKRPQFEALALPRGHRLTSPLPGADLVQVGVVKRSRNP